MQIRAFICTHIDQKMNFILYQPKNSKERSIISDMQDFDLLKPKSFYVHRNEKTEWQPTFRIERKMN